MFSEETLFRLYIFTPESPLLVFSGNPSHILLAMTIGVIVHDLSVNHIVVLVYLPEYDTTLTSTIDESADVILALRCLNRLLRLCEEFAKPVRE